jgi:nicotinamidase-related amidase
MTVVADPGGGAVDPSGERLLDVDDSVLCVIDVQPGFADDLDDAVRDAAVQRIAWVVALAGALDVPVVMTEEEPERNGPTIPEVLALIPPGAARHEKPVFGLADVPEILASVEATGRRTAVLIGMQTDVCVAHSALGLLDRGFRVVVVRDAVASPGAAHEDGLDRMRTAGVVALGAKGLLYEWVRTVARARWIGDVMAGIPLPHGMVL